MDRLLGAAFLLLLSSNAVTAQSSVQLGATWIPVDTNAAIISNLRQNNLGDGQSQIAGYSTLGVIPTDAVAAWLNQLISNPSFREGTVRWQPTQAYKCASNTVGCYKSVHITVLEYTYVNPNASDCKAYALVAADAILPQQAILTDGTTSFQPSGPVTYQITAAPNSTATSCTYVVQYPPATQTLANQLCTDACFNSTCQPCKANQTITGSDSSGCTQANGISPALVAAIQGAGLCLAPGPLGRFKCQVSSGLSATACSEMACFPGDALVEVEAQGRKQMQQLRLGDRVKVVKPDGSINFEDVYLFGHRDEHAVSQFIRLEVKEVHGQSRHSIRLSSKHFLPVGKRWQEARQVRAEEVQVGDITWANAAGVLKPHVVTSRGHVTEMGLWAPLTGSGTILVDGVAASVHSDWYLDPIFDAIGRPDLLPAIYQVLLLPLRALYMLVGPTGMQWIDGHLDMTSLLLHPSLGLKSTSLAASAVALITHISRRIARQLP